MTDEFPMEPLERARDVARSMAELSRSIQDNAPYLTKHLPTVTLLNLALGLSVTSGALLDFADEIDKLDNETHKEIT